MYKTRKLSATVVLLQKSLDSQDFIHILHKIHSVQEKNYEL